jgi:ribosome-binding factor A
MVRGLREPTRICSCLAGMTSRKRRPRRKFSEALCASIGPDDGFDPRDDECGFPRPARNRKALQLCKQVAETLNLALAGCADPLLNDLLVVEVRPAPDSTRMLVLVQSATKSQLAVPEVREHLERALGMLRQEVARQIHRRKTPDLAFNVLEV